MANEVYYSALHWAKKAEASAKEAAEFAQTGGKVIQLGFDGAMENGKLVFKHAPGGVEIPYTLVDDVEYELDLAYSGSLDSLTTISVKNGADVINFVSAVHRSSAEPARVADMDAVMRYDATTGYRWLFKATYKITPSGTKVFLLYPVVAKEDTSKITNCITEIPQDIKLELVDGTLTLKAGSKVYVPNGAGKFDEVVISGDKTVTGFTTGADNVQFLLFINSINQSPYCFRVQDCYSGSAAPTATAVGNMMWYDTSNNIIQNSADQGSTWGNVWGLPLAVVTASNKVVTSIDQVFNGFGYIGSTVFALPNVKGLIPNGRNADGSLKNVEIVNSRVKTVQVANGNRTLVLTPSTVSGYADTIYHTETNTNTNAAGAYQDCCHCGKVVVENGAITSFTPKLPFRADVR